MRKVLFIDDDSHMVSSLSLWFSEIFPDYKLLIARKIKEAMTHLEKEKIDLIISDYDLGNEKGTKLLEWDTPLTCPIIFLTGRGSKQVMQELANKHVFSILEKGADLSELESMILSALRTREETLQKEKMSFIGHNSATLLHEINNPLTIILGKIELLKINLEKKIPNYQEEHSIIKNIQSIEDASQRLLKLMKRTKNVINGNNDFDLKNMSFHVFLNQFIEDSQEFLSRENIKLTVNVQEDFNVIFDSVSFYQIFGNLLSNSIDVFNEVNATDRAITIATENVGMFKHITFEDNGPGIPCASKDKIFEKLYTTKTGANGTGLGLHVCREIVQAHMGEMFLDKTAKGAKFIIKLPVK